MGTILGDSGASTWLQILASSLTICVTSGSSFHLSDLSFFTCNMGIITAPTQSCVTIKRGYKKH